MSGFDKDLLWADILHLRPAKRLPGIKPTPLGIDDVHPGIKRPDLLPDKFRIKIPKNQLGFNISLP